jgi:hypothetical protein
MNFLIASIKNSYTHHQFGDQCEVPSAIYLESTLPIFCLTLTLDINKGKLSYLMSFPLFLSVDK